LARRRGLELLAKASKLEPGDFRIKRDMAQTYEMQGEWQKVIEFGEETAKILSEKIASTPADDFLRSDLHSTQELIGRCYGRLGDMDKRFEAFRKDMRAPLTAVNVSVCFSNTTAPTALMKQQSSWLGN
jgi:hypothetical protein